MVGVLHDFDWDVCPSPEEHPQYGAGILRERGYPEEIVRAVLSHGNHTGISRETTMEKALFAMDELSGFVTAVGPGAAQQEPWRDGGAIGAQEDDCCQSAEVGHFETREDYCYEECRASSLGVLL